MEDSGIRVELVALETFCQCVFETLALTEVDAAMAASVLVAADARDT